MSLVRLNPFREMQDLHTAVNRLFNDRWLSDFFDGRESVFTGGRWSPAVDIHETADEVIFTAEVPGFEKDDIDITVNEGRLSIRGERTFEEQKNEAKYHQVERWSGHFYRSFLLPTSVQEEKISASLKNGILTVTLPKKEEAKPRQITVSVK